MLRDSSTRTCYTFQCQGYRASSHPIYYQWIYVLSHYLFSCIIPASFHLSNNTFSCRTSKSSMTCLNLVRSQEWSVKYRQQRLADAEWFRSHHVTIGGTVQLSVANSTDPYYYMISQAVKLNLCLCSSTALVGSGGKASRILNPNTGRRRILSFRHQPLCPLGNNAWYPLYRRLVGLKNRNVYHG
jgi:hypothetical protein